MIQPGRQSVVVVGAGIQGLLAALALRDRGLAVRVHSAGQDPRSGGETRSSTSDGEAIRLITLLEGCPYVGHAVDSAEIAGVFERPVSEGGWLGSPYQNTSSDWLRARQVAWFDRDRVAKTLRWFVATSRQSMAKWEALQVRRPELFIDADWHSRGVLRLYDDANTAAVAADVHRALGVLQETVSPEALTATTSAFADAARAGVVRGAFRVNGFAFNIKRFVGNLIDALERDGVSFVWQSECEQPSFDSAGRVEGLRFRRTVETADSYVIAPGAYAGAGLLKSLGVEVSGLAGRWLLLPKPNGFDLPTKVHFGPRVMDDGLRPVLDLNLMSYLDTVRQREMLAIGGGYLHVGSYPFSYDAAELRLIDDEIDRAVGRLLPKTYADAKSAGTLVRSTATCVRSLTADDRPAVVCRETTAGGRLIFHTGLNTGTTTLAPAIAADIAAVIAGETGPESLVL